MGVWYLRVHDRVLPLCLRRIPLLKSSISAGAGQASQKALQRWKERLLQRRVAILRVRSLNDL